MDKSEDISKLAAALVSIQSEVTVAKKEDYNPHFKSKFAGLGAVVEAAKPVLKKYAVAVVQSPVVTSEGQVGLRTTLLHSSGQYISTVVSSPLQKQDPQGVGSAITYLRRYCLAAALGIVADEDDDAESAVSRPTANPRKNVPFKIAERVAEKDDDL